MTINNNFIYINSKETPNLNANKFETNVIKQCIEHKILQATNMNRNSSSLFFNSTDIRFAIHQTS